MCPRRLVRRGTARFRTATICRFTCDEREILYAHGREQRVLSINEQREVDPASSTKSSVTTVTLFAITTSRYSFAKRELHYETSGQMPVSAGLSEFMRGVLIIIIQYYVE